MSHVTKPRLITGRETMKTTITLALKPGDRVALPGGIVRTVESVRPSGHVNFADEPLYIVSYVEDGSAEWSAANIGHAQATWTLA
jgi:hypothetical protein